MVKWLELSIAISLLLVMVFIIIPLLMANTEPNPYQDCLDKCLSCSNDNYFVYKDECEVCITLCKDKHLTNSTQNDT